MAEESIADLLGGVWEYGRTFEIPGQPLRALYHARKHSMPEGLVVPLPMLAAAALQKDFEGRFSMFEFPYAANSEEHIGRGFFRGHQKTWVVTIHGGVQRSRHSPDGGGLLISPRYFHAHQNQGVTQARLVDLGIAYNCDGKQLFQNLLEGKMPDGSEIAVFRYDDIVSSLKHYPLILSFDRFTIVREYNQARQTTNSDVYVANLMDGKGTIDSQLVAHLGSQELAKAYVEKLLSRSSPTYTMRHPLNHAYLNPNQPQGYMLCFYPDGTIGGSFEKRWQGLPVERFFALNHDQLAEYRKGKLEIDDTGLDLPAQQGGLSIEEADKLLTDLEHD